MCKSIHIYIYDKYYSINICVYITKRHKANRSMDTDLQYIQHAALTNNRF